jgi:hypothetical protein
MWKIVLGFVVFAAIILYVISRAGDQIDMSGESHSTDAKPAAVPASGAASKPAP